MNLKLRNLTWAISILLAYPLYSVGQIYLFISKQKDPDFYALINKYPDEWIAAHIFLMISLVLLIPAFTGICNYFKNSSSYTYILFSTFFTFLSVFALFGQFTIDLCLVEIFKLPVDTAYQTLHNIQNNFLISALFYDNSKLLFVFKYADPTLMGQLFLGIALFVSGKIPPWVKAVFILSLLGTQVGMLIGPFYGRIIKRLSYSLISVSLIPIAVSLLTLMRTNTKNEYHDTNYKGN